MKRDIKKLHRILTELGELCSKSKYIEGDFSVSPNYLDKSSIVDNLGFREMEWQSTEYDFQIKIIQHER